MIDFITLPQIIIGDQNLDDIFIFRHCSKKPVLKNKIILQKNLISLLTNGQKVLQFANKTTVIDCDHFAILSAGNCLMTEKLSTDAKYESTLLFFDNSMLISFLLKYAGLISKIKPLNLEVDTPFVVLRKDPFIVHYTESLNLLIQKNTPLSMEMKRLKFEELMLHLLDKYPQAVMSFHPDPQNDADDFEIKRVTEANIYRNMTIEELAFLCNSSLSTFKRRFSKIYKTSPNKYFLHRKLEEAAVLLVHHGENPSTVFHKVGYENLSSFSHSFKQLYGVSPKRYQQQRLSL